MCRRDMIRVVSRVGVWKDLSYGPLLGFINEVIHVWGRVWGVSVRLMTTCMMSIACMPCQCERSAFARGCVSYDTVAGVFKVVIYLIFLFS
jgi:hypothetical protein